MSTCRLLFLETCKKCGELYDHREDGLGMEEGVCLKCNIKDLKDIGNCNRKEKCQDRKCRFCFERSFANSEKAIYWHPTKNGNVKPRNVSLRTQVKYWFRCESCEHDFHKSLQSIKGKGWCGYCANHKRCDAPNCKFCFEHSFASHEKAKYWNYEKNGDIKPRDVAKSDGNKYWFTCEKCGHDIDLALGNIHGGNWCGYCANHKRCDEPNCKFCFDNSFASHEKAKYWNYEKNGNIKPRDVAKFDNRKYWLTCNLCKHDLNMGLNNVKPDRWCLYCVNQKRCEASDCKFCFEHSFASHEKAKYWNHERNKNTPRDVAKFDNSKYWFTCESCRHDINKSLGDIQRGDWCSYCANLKRCEKSDCKFCFDHSFASHEKAKYWNYERNKNTPRDVAKSNGHKYWFTCETCGHNIHVALNKIIGGKWCAYCVNQKRCEESNCKFCFDHSFASHEKAKYWNYERNGNIKPRDVAKATGRKYWFTCPKCNNDINTTLGVIHAGSWCKYCTQKTEAKLLQFLLSIFDEVESQFKLESCKNSKTGKYFPFDFCLQSMKIIIEVDGMQHFHDVPHWNSLAKNNRSRDIYKMREANNNGYSVIRIVQEDIWHDTYDWKTDVIHSIEKCKTVQQNVFCSNDTNKELYDDYKMGMKTV